MPKFEQVDVDVCSGGFSVCLSFGRNVLDGFHVEFKVISLDLPWEVL